ncbi:sugar transferase [Mycolicibacterium thermoresistibile]
MVMDEDVLLDRPSVDRRRVLTVDAAIITVVLGLAHAGTFRADTRDGWLAGAALSVLLACCWLLALELQQSRDISLVGIGAEEYRRVVTATIWVFGLAAVVSVLIEARLPRDYLGIALAVGLSALLLGRHCVRRDLNRRRMQGKFITRVVVLGRPESVHLLCSSFGRTPGAGYRVVGVCLPGFTGTVGAELATPTGVVPVLGGDDAVESALRLAGADALAVAAIDHIGHEKMRRLVWRLQSMDTDLIVVPGMTDVAGHRLRMRPIDNLPLFHVSAPRQEGPSVIAKRVFDLTFGMAALAAALPVMVVAPAAIKIDDGGPIIFRQRRVGQSGETFRIVKFRTMRVDAEARHDAERTAARHHGVFFKSATDSRVTRVGRYLRATSIDELPQLLNVLAGSMSIVGPRPLVPGEGQSVEHFLERRALVKPGITGLWQTSGRSALSEDERIRLDHSYIDNWSYVHDLVIVWRTIRTVLKREGAM